MEEINLEDIKPVKGFKLMERLRKVREEQYTLYRFTADCLLLIGTALLYPILTGK
jgi:hypothetical protein